MASKLRSAETRTQISFVTRKLMQFVLGDKVVSEEYPHEMFQHFNLLGD